MMKDSIPVDLFTPAAPPLPQRRPRVREVSSRFMSPSTSGDLPHPPVTVKSPLFKSTKQQRLKTIQRRRHEQEPFTFCAHENIPETIRSLDTPLGSRIYGQRKQRAVKLFKENGSAEQQQLSSSDVLHSKTQLVGIGKSSRPDTPNCAQTTDRIIPSRFRNSHSQTNSTDASKLLHSTGLSSSCAQSQQERTSIPLKPSSYDINGDTLVDSRNLVNVSNSCPNSPILVQNGRTWSLPDILSSMPEGDMLPTRLLAAAEKISCTNSSNTGNCQISKTSPSPCSRSLNLPLSSCERSSSSSILSNPSTNSVSTENRGLPPQPTCVRLGVDARKGRKLLTSQEEVHSLKLLHNHYLQWRFANAKAEASMHAQQKESESQLYSGVADISDLRDVVKRKRIEVELLQRTKALSTILETHMPYLDEWSALEEDYSNSLSGASHALVNSLLRLPLSGNVQVNIKEIAEALHSAIKTMEMISVHVQSFMPKAGEMDTSISELARVIGGERALIEECGNLLFKTYTSQVEDCSLRGHLMQLHCRNHFQVQQVRKFPVHQVRCFAGVAITNQLMSSPSISPYALSLQQPKGVFNLHVLLSSPDLCTYE